MINNRFYKLVLGVLTLSMIGQMQAGVLDLYRKYPVHSAVSYAIDKFPVTSLLATFGVMGLWARAKMQVNELDALKNGLNIEVENKNYSWALVDEVPVVLAHGFGMEGKDFEGMSQRLGRRVVYFDFNDAVKDGNMPWTEMNLGQEPDAKNLLLTLKNLQENGTKKVHGLGFSRGGAAWVQTLYMLVYPEKYSNTLEELKITKEQATAIRDMVLNGKIVLAHPLMSASTAIKNTTKNIFSGISTLCNNLWDKLVNYCNFGSVSPNNVSPDLGSVGGYSAPAIEFGLSSITRYDSFAKTPIDMLKEIAKNDAVNSKLQLGCFVAKDKSDTVVTHEHDDELKGIINSLCEKNTSNVFMASGYGHCDIQHTIMLAKNFY